MILNGQKAGVLAFFVVLLSTAIVRAADPALAEALYQDGKRLAGEGKWAQACPKFEASYQADRTLGTLLNLADCREHLGLIATAWAEWNEAIELAQAKADERSEYATERRDKLTPRLPKLEIAVTRPVRGLEVYRDGVRVEPGAYNSALPVDPGKHEVTVRRGAAVLERRSAAARETATSRVELDLTAIDQAHPAAPAGAGGTQRAGLPDSPDSPGRSQRTIGLIVGGVGVAALVTAGAFGLVAISSKGKADAPDQCVNKYCSASGLQSADRADTFAELSQWVGLGGLIATAAGVTLVLTAPSAPERSAQGRAKIGLVPAVGPAGAGLIVTGRL